MDIEQVTKRAQEYVQRETHGFFRSDVLSAINREDIEGLTDRFYQELTFGTAGMRGVIGGGSNRMNPLAVARVTEGLGRYITGHQEDALVVIAYDTRNFSRLFAETAAQVLCRAGLTVQMFADVAPVPILSFAVRHLGAQAGITITASHNPSEYNGYKVYWADGAQVTPPHDEGIVTEVEAVRESGEPVEGMPLKEAEALGRFSWVDQQLHEDYYAMVRSVSIRPELFSRRESTLTVVFTPLHGTGLHPVERVLRDLGVSVITVDEQRDPDGNFPTVKNPNPEDPDAMSLALTYGVSNGADIILGTDPDGDRLGIAVPTTPDKTGYRLLTGNQIAVLLCDYICSGRRESGMDQLVTVKSIVTTDLMEKITEHYGGRCVNVLTGFKYIAQVIEQLAFSEEHFVFGAEESYGYLVEQDVRDKDAVSAAAMAVEMAQYHLKRGVSLLQHLEELYGQFGYHQERVLSRTLPGQKGQQQISRLMDHFRMDVTDGVAGSRVVSRMDLLQEGTGLPKTNMLIYRLEEARSFILRPSGTEPKIKCYLFCSSGEKDLTAARREVMRLLDRYEEFFDDQLSLIRSRTD